jgi:hypothetical protein
LDANGDWVYKNVEEICLISRLAKAFDWHRRDWFSVLLSYVYSDQFGLGRNSGRNLHRMV